MLYEEYTLFYVIIILVVPVIPQNTVKFKNALTEEYIHITVCEEAYHCWRTLTLEAMLILIDRQ